LDSKFHVASFRVVNIENSKPHQLLDFIRGIEGSFGINAVKNLMPMQAGEVHATLADTTLLEMLTGYVPTTDITTGVQNFVSWYRDYYKV
jgi:UDP-glucuronate 4-epimerase